MPFKNTTKKNSFILKNFFLSVTLGSRESAHLSNRPAASGGCDAVCSASLRSVHCSFQLQVSGISFSLY